MKITAADIDKTVEQYAKSLELKNSIAVEFDSFNEVDPLTLIRTFDVKPEASELTTLAEIMFNGKQLKFLYGDTVLKSIVYNNANGAKISHLFSDNPSLLDILLNTVYVLLLKKLTLQLED